MAESVIQEAPQTVSPGQIAVAHPPVSGVPRVNNPQPGWEAMQAEHAEEFAEAFKTAPSNQRPAHSGPAAQPRVNKSAVAQAESAEPAPTDTEPASEQPTSTGALPNIPRRARQWREVQATHAKEKAELQAQIETLKKGTSAAPAAATAPADPAPDLVALRAERDALQTQLRAVAIERDPEIQSKFKQTSDFIDAKAKGLLGDEKGAAFSKILQLPDGPHRTQLLDQIYEGVQSPSAHGQLAVLIDRADAMANERAALQAKGEQAWTQLEQNRKAQQDQQRAQLNSRFDNVLSALSDRSNGIAVFQSSEDAKANGEVQQRVALARQIFSGGMEADDLAKAALYAAALPCVVASHNATLQRVAALEAENAKLRGNSPSVRPFSEDGTQEVSQSEQKRLSSLGYGGAVAHHAFNELGLR